MSRRRLLTGLALVVMTASLVSGAVSAQALGWPDPCVDPASGSLAFSTSTLTAGEDLQVSWSAYLPRDCSGTAGLSTRVDLHLYDNDGHDLIDPPIPMYGQMNGGVNTTTMALPVTYDYDKGVSIDSYALVLKVTEVGGIKTKVLGSPQTVTVNPPPALPAGTAVTITTGGPAGRAAFVQGMVTPGAKVTIAGNVDLDLTGIGFVPVAQGVTLIGDRTVYPTGPRLYTRTFMRWLLAIGNDNVRITGIRFDGGESDEATTYAALPFDADGIDVFAAVNVEIDHNEFFRWHGGAIHVRDNTSAFDQGRLNRDNALTAVHIHDNFIHDNQHPTASGLMTDGHGAGYGVEVTDGAYAYIDRNVFTNNRHAITASGAPWTGYFAYSNLFLHPGIDRTTIGIVSYNHHIDVHGTQTCGSGESYNCGPAGQYFEVRNNTVMSTAADAIQLRGTPTDGMTVGGNVFEQSADHALTHTDAARGMFDAGNTYSSTAFYDTSRSCDFDGDGIADSFRTSGINWWYLSSRLGYFVYLYGSNLSGAYVSLGDLDGDNRCDAAWGAGVLYNTDPVMFLRPQADLSTPVGTVVDFHLIASGGAPAYTWTVTGLPPGVSADATGHVTGRVAMTRTPTFAVTATATDRNHQTKSITFTWSALVTVPGVIGYDQYSAQSIVEGAGFVVVVNKSNDCNAPGDVEIESPEPGAQVLPGSTVTLRVSTCDRSGSGGGSGGGGSGGGPILPK